MDLTYEVLKEHQREIRDGFPEGLALRTHRALSWLQRAEMENDLDAKFIFQWVAFNAADAHEIRDRKSYSEKRLYVSFMQCLIENDSDNLFYNTIWTEFSGSIKSILENRYVFQPFWDFHNGYIEEEEWLDKFNKNKTAAKKAVGSMDTKKALPIIFERFYVLRNQLLHGGATWNSRVNRDQIKEGTNLLGKLIPIVIHTMMSNPNLLWGDPCYPVVKT